MLINIANYRIMNNLFQIMKKSTVGISGPIQR